MTFFDLLVRYQTRLWNHIDNALREADAVGLATLETLRVVARHDGHGRVQDVADDLAITPGAASKIVDRLEAATLINRQPNPQDRRSVVLRLSALGEERYSEAESIASRALERHLAGTAVDVDAITLGLRTLNDHIINESRGLA
jgi:DNA-binding MarR family transcriptional regulator